jgi:hypothetical protein
MKQLKEWSEMSEAEQAEVTTLSLPSWLATVQVNQYLSNDQGLSM